MNTKNKNIGGQTNKLSTGPRRTMSLQENTGKLLKNGNVKTGRALSVGVRPSPGVGDSEEDQHIAKISK